MSKKTGIIIGAIVAVIIGIIIWMGVQEDAVAPTVDTTFNTEGITLFYGDGCPHCKDVEEYIAQNDIKNKVTFTELEVWKNKDNAKMMEEAATICKLDLKTIGVPFVFAQGQCYIGGPDVQEFFAQQAGI
jgi:glutaredoxin